MPAYYRTSLAEFVTGDPQRILGILTEASSSDGFYELKHRQTKAWLNELQALRATAAAVIATRPASAGWALLLEFPIPRRHKRVDAVILAGAVVVVLEFKSDQRGAIRQAQQQAEDYALDLRDFHAGSLHRQIIGRSLAL